MSKYDLNSVVAEVQKLYNKEKSKLDSIGTGENLKTLADGNFIPMPDWWQQVTNTKGLPFGAIVQLAGDSDSGKTSAAIAAMKAAQVAGVAVLYGETEHKTTKEDLLAWGVDPQIMMVSDMIAEPFYKKFFQLRDAFFKKYPEGRLLQIVDSFGNLMSQHDAELDLEEDSQRPGGKGKINRLALNKIIAGTRQGAIATLIINYTYDNMGSPGKTNAGGKALNFFSSLTYQTSRKQWLEKTVKGEKVRIGARVQWTLFKNHVDKSNPGPKRIELDITADGIEVSGTSNE